MSEKEMVLDFIKRNGLTMAQVLNAIVKGTEVWAVLAIKHNITIEQLRRVAR
jgi:hypothetical protein